MYLVSEEKVNKIVKEKGFELIEPFENSSIKLKLIDKDGYKYSIMWDYFRNKNAKFQKFEKHNIYTIDNIKHYIELNNIPVKLISKSINSSEDKLEWKDKENHTFYRKYSNVIFLKQINCTKCVNKSKQRPITKEYKEKIEEILKNKGYELVELINSNNIKIRDKEGYLYNITSSKLYKGCNPIRFGKSNKNSLFNLKLFIKLNNLSCKLLSNNYVNQKEDLEWECECGKTYLASGGSIVKFHKLTCKECTIKKRGEDQLVPIEEIKNKLHYKGLTLIEQINNSKHNKRRFKVEDKEGYLYSLDLGQIKDSKNLLRFHTGNEFTLDNIKNYLKLNYMKMEIMSEKYNGAEKDLLCRCQCGNTFITTWSRILNQGQYRCRICSKVKSIGEQKIEEWLNNNNKIFKNQFWLKDCRDTCVLPFDFCVFDKYKNIQALIEFDGRQHFEPVRWNKEITIEQAKENLALVKKHDNIKNTYCKINNIKLIRIPYWNLDDGTYKNILNNNLK